MLYIVATPIGNLSDFTFRAIETLKTVDIILCEDTRVTKKLLNHFDISTPTMSYHQHSSESVIQKIQELLQEGKQLALVSDAGTPGINDPGNELISQLTRLRPSESGYAGQAKNNDPVIIIPIPGPSAAIAALSVSGFQTDKFTFLGFPPQKKRRNQFFEEVALSPYTTVFFESPYRIKKAIQALSDVLEPHRKLCISREITKKFETTYRGTIQEIQEMNISEKGEFVVVVSGQSKQIKQSRQNTFSA